MSYRENPLFDESLKSILSKIQADIRQMQRLDGRAGSSQALPYTIGKWVLSENGGGQLIATHVTSGHVTVIAAP